MARSDAEVIGILTERGTKPDLYEPAGRFVAERRMYVGPGYFGDRDAATIRAEFARWLALTPRPLARSGHFALPEGEGEARQRQVR